MVCVRVISSKDVWYCDEKMETCAGGYLTSRRSHARPHPRCHPLLPHGDLQSSQAL